MKLSFETLLNELGVTTHFKERLNDRILSSNLKTNLTYKINDTRRVEEIGTFTIPQNIMSIINNNVEIISNARVKREITFAVFIYKFTLNDIWNNTNLYDLKDVREISRILKFQKGRLTINDDKTNNYGISVVGIIKNRTLVTIVFENTNSKEFLYSGLKNGKYSKDDLIVLDSTEDLEYYYEDKNRNIDALH
jgi:hypothetical protein